MTKRDYYAVLELTRACTLPEVRQSFKKLALKWHPDKCVDKIEAELRFNEIHEAYSVLTDDKKKKLYDDYGHDGLKAEEDRENNNSGHSFFQKGFQGTDKSAFDVLKDIFQDNDDYFFQNYNNFGIPSDFQSNIKSFIEENVLCNTNEPETNFCETYQPSFMNPSFCMAPPEFPNLGFSAQPTSQVFSFLSMSTGNNAYTSSSSMMFQNRISSSTSEIFENLSTMFEAKVTTNCTQKPAENINNKNYDSLLSNRAKDGPILVLDDESDNSPDGNTTQDTEHFSFGDFEGEMSSESDTQQRISSPSKKINKMKDSLNIRFANKKPSKKNRA